MEHIKNSYKILLFLFLSNCAYQSNDSTIKRTGKWIFYQSETVVLQYESYSFLQSTNKNQEDIPKGGILEVLALAPPGEENQKYYNAQIFDIDGRELDVSIDTSRTLDAPCVTLIQYGYGDKKYFRFEVTDDGSNYIVGAKSTYCGNKFYININEYVGNEFKVHVTSDFSVKKNKNKSPKNLFYIQPGEFTIYSK